MTADEKSMIVIRAVRPGKVGGFECVFEKEIPMSTAKLFLEYCTKRGLANPATLEESCLESEISDCSSEETGDEAEERIRVVEEQLARVAREKDSVKREISEFREQRVLEEKLSTLLPRTPLVLPPASRRSRGKSPPPGTPTAPPNTPPPPWSSVTPSLAGSPHDGVGALPAPAALPEEAPLLPARAVSTPPELALPAAGERARATQRICDGEAEDLLDLLPSTALNLLTPQRQRLSVEGASSERCLKTQEGETPVPALFLCEGDVVEVTVHSVHVKSEWESLAFHLSDPQHEQCIHYSRAECQVVQLAAHSVPPYLLHFCVRARGGAAIAEGKYRLDNFLPGERAWLTAAAPRTRTPVGRVQLEWRVDGRAGSRVPDIPERIIDESPAQPPSAFPAIERQRIRRMLPHGSPERENPTSQLSSAARDIAVQDATPLAAGGPGGPGRTRGARAAVARSSALLSPEPLTHGNGMSPSAIREADVNEDEGGLIDDRLVSTARQRLIDILSTENNELEQCIQVADELVEEQRETERHLLQDQSWVIKRRLVSAGEIAAHLGVESASLLASTHAAVKHGAYSLIAPGQVARNGQSHLLLAASDTLPVRSVASGTPDTTRAESSLSEQFNSITTGISAFGRLQRVRRAQRPDPKKVFSRKEYAALFAEQEAMDIEREEKYKYYKALLAAYEKAQQELGKRISRDVWELSPSDFYSDRVERRLKRALGKLVGMVPADAPDEDDEEEDDEEPAQSIQESNILDRILGVPPSGAIPDEPVIMMTPQAAQKSSATAVLRTRAQRVMTELATLPLDDELGDD